MIVWRLENADGRGPYSVSAIRSEFNDMFNAHTDKKHPTIYADSKVDINFKAGAYSGITLYGFDSERKLLKWFDGYLDRLLKVGFKIVQYEIDSRHVNIYKYQLIFKYAHAVAKDVKIFEGYNYINYKPFIDFDAALPTYEYNSMTRQKINVKYDSNYYFVNSTTGI